MTQKQILLVTLAILGGGLFMYEYRDWFSARPIQISHRFYAFGGRFDSGGKAPLMFEFDRKLKLTSIKVVSIADALTNKYPHALWTMTSKSTSVPTRGFLYGMDVPGMQPAVNGVSAEPLEVEGKYRLMIQAGSLKAQHDFDLDPTPR
jgi:hypothetical protein